MGRKVRKHASPEPPDGGWGWVVAVGSNVTLQFSLLIRCAGVFFNDWKDHFGASATAVSAVTSAHMASFLFMGPLGGYLCNRIGQRKLAIMGGVMASVSLLVGSYSKSLLHLIICFGFFAGIGCGFAYVSAITIIGKYFKKRYATANSIANSGTGLAIIVLPVLSRFLINLYNWNGAMFVLAAFSSNICVCGMLFRPLRRKPNDEGVVSSERQGSELSDTPTVERTRFRVEMEESSGLQYQEHNGRDGPGSHGKLYRKISTSSGCESESEGNDRNVEASSTGKPHGRVSSSSGCDSGSEKDVPNLSSISDGKPHGRVSASSGCDSEASEDAPHAADFSDGEPRNRISVNSTCPSDAEEHDSHSQGVASGEFASLQEAPAAGGHSNTTTNFIDSKLKQRRPTRGSVYLGNFIRGSGLYLIKTRYRFNLMCLMQITQAMSYSTIMIHLVPMTIDAGITKLDAAVLLSINGVGSMAGRLSSGLVVDHNILGPMKLYVLVILTSGVAIIIGPTIHSYTGFVVFAVIFGVVSGIYKSLNAVLIRLFVGAEQLSLAYGIFMPFVGIGNVMGPLFAGWLYDIRDNYDLAFYIAGSLLVLGTLVFLLMPYLERMERMERKRHPDEAERPEAGLPLGSMQSISAV